jgi:hypothetical protein
MSSPKQNATPAEMAALAKLNKKLYGTKPEIGPGKSMAGGDISGAIKAATQAVAKEKPQDIKEVEPRRPTPLPPRRPTPLPPTPKRPDPIPPRPGRSDPLPLPVKPLPPREPVKTQMPALRPTGKPSNQMEYKKGGSVPSASKRGDGIAQRGKTRGKMR